jgi:diguanylate cyclase (GGDEF)-like protein
LPDPIPSAAQSGTDVVPAPAQWGAGSGRRPWLLIAGTILVLGVAASLAAALLWRASLHTRERETFRTTATNVDGALGTLLRRHTDFVRSVRAVLTMEPNVTATRLDEWFTQLEDREAQPVGFGGTVTRIVPAGELASFQARRNADPAFRKFVGGQIEPIIPTGRARYCLLSAGSTNITFDPALAQLLQADWCDPNSLIGGYRQNTDSLTRAQATQAITDSGQFAVYPLTFSGISSLIIEGAFYRHGARIATVSQRRAAVLGWVSGSFNIPLLLRSALGGVSGMTVTLYHSNPGLGPEFIGRLGNTANAHPFTQQTRLQVNGSWLVKVTGAPVVSGPSANLQALVVFLGGTVATLLLLALMVVLTRSRSRALQMVHAKTGQLRHQALHDALTGLPNRVLALDRAEQMLARTRRQDLPVAALYVDVDGFKHVNDSFGHAAGDELLRLVATRLASVVREVDTAARLGGDEFIVLVEGSALDAGPELVAERLLEVLREPYNLEGEIGRQLSVTASIGIASGVRDDADQLLRDADIALYEAKAAGRDRYMTFQSGMQSLSQDRLVLQMDLAEALEKNQLFLLYQPVFDLKSEAVIGVEALLRWRHPTRGIVSPVDFIPIAEEGELIMPIGRWVLQEACRQAASWHAQTGRQVGMSVNVSSRQLDNDRLINDVRQALEDSGLEPATLTLEVTETTLMRDPDATARRLNMLKELGVRIAIDDFGTGYSSLAYLRQFPADALKIDRSFIGGIAASKRSRSLIRTLVQLGKTLEIETLAEGIEEPAQLKALQREHCDQGQGFLFARPLEVDAIEAFLRASQPAMQTHTAP